MERECSLLRQQIRGTETELALDHWSILNSRRNGTELDTRSGFLRSSRMKMKPVRNRPKDEREQCSQQQQGSPCQSHFPQLNYESL